MNKKRKASIFVLFSVIITLIMATGISANAEYDEYGNYYEPSSVIEEESSQVSLSSIDTSELTSEDWEKVEENLNSAFHTSTDKNTSASTASTNDGDFKSIKDNLDTSNDSNDTWIYLFIGLVLITVGVVAIVFVIATTVHTKHTVKAQPKHSTNNKPSSNNNNTKTDKK